MSQSRQLVISVDVESLGLYGTGFAVGVSVWDKVTRQEVDTFYGRVDHTTCPDFAHVSTDTMNWLNQHVFPVLDPVNYESLFLMREAFWSFIQSWKAQGSCEIIADCGSPVEAHFWADCVKQDINTRNYQGPYPLHELATRLLQVGLDPIGTFPRTESELPLHHPVKDARQSARLWLEHEP